MTVPQNQLQVNHPFKLLPSKNPSPNSASASHFLAQQMSILHNSLLRTLNLIYNQAPHISSAADVRAFLALIKHWHDELQQHLKIEEEIFFPLLEKATGVKGIMENIVDERFYFEIGVEALGRYAVETDVQGYDGFEVQALIDDFGKMLIEHFAEEVEALEGLGGCDDGKLRRAWEGTREFVRRSGGSYVRLPMLMRGTNENFENGESGDFGFSWFSSYLLGYFSGRKHQNAWAWGQPESLATTMV